MVELRDYQQACHDAVLRAWGEIPSEQETYRSVLAVLTTSAGKTVIAGALIETLSQKGRCLYIADSDELCEQPEDTFSNLFGLSCQTEKAQNRAGPSARVVIGSAQTLGNPLRIKEFTPDHFSYLFVDEAHRGSDRNKRICDYFASAKVMGMTATAFRAKTSEKTGLADLSDYYEHVAFEMGMFDLINEGYITPIKVLTLPVKVDITKVHQKKGDFDGNELDTTIRPYYEEICDLILKHAPNRQIICFLPLRKSSSEFVVIAQGKGINARHIQGDSPDRDYLKRSFQNRDFQLLSNSSLLATGWDCPPCDCLLNLTPTRLPGIFRQKVGRIGRVLPGVINGIHDAEARKAAIAKSRKPDALILDLLWQTEKYGLIGPADLVAKNDRERLAINSALAKGKGALDLQGVSRDLQEQHEQALKKALEEVGRRHSVFTDAINLVAAMLHGSSVLNYEPVMKSDAAPATPKQKAWLAKHGIDPESARDKGHVSAFMNLIFGRERSGLCSYKAVKALEAAGIKNPISVRAVTAYEILGGDYPMSFGKHAAAGRTLKQVPKGYWLHCLEQSWFRNFPIELAWARKMFPAGQLPHHCTCIGSHKAPNCPLHAPCKTAGPALDWGKPGAKFKIPY